MSGGKDWLLPPPVPALNVWREEGRQSEKERREKVREEREHGLSFRLCLSETKWPQKNMSLQLVLQLNMINPNTEHDARHILMKTESFIDKES